MLFFCLMFMCGCISDDKADMAFAEKTCEGLDFGYANSFLYCGIRNNDTFLIKEYLHLLTSSHTDVSVMNDRLFVLYNETKFHFGMLDVMDKNSSWYSLTLDEQLIYKRNCALVYDIFFFNSCRDQMVDGDWIEDRKFMDWWFSEYQVDTIYDADRDRNIILNKMNEVLGCTVTTRMPQSIEL